MRYGDVFNKTDKLLPFGCRVIFMVGFARLGYQIMDLDLFLQEAQIKIVTTRDVRIFVKEFPVKKMVRNGDIKYDDQQGGFQVIDDVIEVDPNNPDIQEMECGTCQKPIIHDMVITCRACRGRHRAHTKKEGCKLYNCNCVRNVDENGAQQGGGQEFMIVETDRDFLDDDQQFEELMAEFVQEMTQNAGNTDNAEQNMIVLSSDEEQGGDCSDDNGVSSSSNSDTDSAEEEATLVPVPDYPSPVYETSEESSKSV